MMTLVFSVGGFESLNRKLMLRRCSGTVRVSDHQNALVIFFQCFLVELQQSSHRVQCY